MNYELWTMYHETRLTQPIRAAHPFDEIPLYICRGFSTNQLLFMQNKPNVKDAQISVSSYMKSKYEKLDTWLSGKNKPNSNPIKPNCQKGEIDAKSVFTKDYRKKDDFKVRINKPNFRNGQNERKLNFNKGLQKKRLFSTPKNKPNSNPILSAVGGLQMNVKSLAGKTGHTRCRLSHIFGLQFGLIVAKYSEICNHRFVSDNKLMHVLSSTCPLPSMLCSEREK